MSHISSAWWARFGTLAATALVLAACGKGQQPTAATPAAADKSATPPVAVVDGQAISRAEYDDYLKSLLPRGKTPGDVTPEEKNQVLDQLITSQLLTEQAVKDGVDKDADVTTQLELLRMRVLAQAEAQKWIKDHQPSDADLHAAYDATTDKTEYHAAHILVATKEKAQDIIKKLKGGAKFEDLAKTESMDNNKAQGGDLGWFTTTKMVKPFGDAVKLLKKGEYTQEPVQTQYGFHVIKLEDTRDAPFDELKPQLTNAALQKAFEAHIEELKKSAKIEKNL